MNILSALQRSAMLQVTDLRSHPHQVGSDLAASELDQFERDWWTAVAKGLRVIPLPAVELVELCLYSRFVRLRITLRLIDVETNQLTQHRRGVELMREAAHRLTESQANEYLAAQLRQLLVDAYTHEVDESIRFANGELVRNQHVTANA